MTLFAETRAALETQLSTLTPARPIAWENLDYDPIDGQEYIQPYLVPATSTLADLAGNLENEGIFQIDCYIPCESGTKALNDLADEISDLFRKEILTAGSAEVRIRAVSYRYVGREDNFYQGAVDVQYRVYS